MSIARVVISAMKQRGSRKGRLRVDGIARRRRHHQIGLRRRRQSDVRERRRKRASAGGQLRLHRA